MGTDVNRDGGIDLAIALFGEEPKLLRDAHVLAASARATGYSAAVRQLSTTITDDQFVDQLGALGAATTAIGVTPNTATRGLGAAQAAMTRRGRPVLLFGRHFAAERYRREVPNEAATGVVVGPPSSVVLDFVRAINGRSGRQVAGLDRLDGDFRPRAPREALGDTTFPTFAEADIVNLRQVGLPIRLSHGCPRRCSFCAEQPLEGSYRGRPAHDVVEELAFHRHENQVRRFQLCDLVINGDLGQLESVCDLVLARNLDIEWWGRALVDPQMPRALYRKLRLAGCVGLDLAIPSGADKVLAAMHVGFTAGDATTALRRATGAGINTRVSLIVGLPGETEREYGQTCSWLRHNRYEIAQIGDIRPARIARESLLYHNHADHGVSLPQTYPEQNWHDGGFNSFAYRLKRTREMRVFVEDALHLEVVGRAPEVTWEDEAREKIAYRLGSGSRVTDVVTGRFLEENRELAGIVQQGEPLSGPTYLEIDLTNNCNQHCAGCWIHSFLLGDKRLTGSKRRATLDVDRLRGLIADAKRMGTRKIQLSGAGEPFMHPHTDEILELIKDQGIELHVVSNFTLVDEERARHLVDVGVDAITVSLWAGSADTYVATHPTAKPELFDKIVRVLGHLTWYRRKTGARGPRVKVYNVVSNLNCHEIHEMIDVAREVGADLIEFTPLDVIEGKTDSLALSQADSQRVLDQLMELRRRPDYLQRTEEEVLHGRLPGLDEQGEFARFVQQHRMAPDFRFCLDDIRRWEAYCRRGVHCSRVYEEIHRDSAIFFGFPACECRSCMAFDDCSIDPITHSVRAPYLSLQGFGSFWRRVKSAAAGTDTDRSTARDAKIVDEVPCSIGYHYARVQATGHVIPCCKAADKPLGDITEQSFEQVWRSEPYQEFRTRALTTLKSDPYFAPMECYKVCDNLGHNMAVDERICALTERERAALAKARQD